MLNKCKAKTVYIDLLGQYHDSIESAERENHEIHLQFRKYIEEELLSTFGDGKYNRLQTTLNIWQMLEFTPECISKILNIMAKK